MSPCYQLARATFLLQSSKSQDNLSAPVQVTTLLVVTLQIVHLLCLGYQIMQQALLKDTNPVV